ncbi:MAG: TIGR00180 family glycosyltransferase, partial [Rhodocyclaceae bacterium]|nr:TIGR00180 family glycosyltransferase [Rhodocyclaceae bacterium]
MNYSLVIISRNRPGFLARLLAYFRNQGLRARIHLGDASSGEAREQVAALVAEFQPGLDIAFTAYDESLSVMERLRRQFEQVETPYAAWVGDDDFLVPSALEAGAALMDAMPGCGAVIGKAVTFSVVDDAVRGPVLAVADYLQLPVVQEVPVDRLLAQSKQGAAFPYSLRR